MIQIPTLQGYFKDLWYIKYSLEWLWQCGNLITSSCSYSPFSYLVYIFFSWIMCSKYISTVLTFSPSSSFTHLKDTVNWLWYYIHCVWTVLGSISQIYWATCSIMYLFFVDVTISSIHACKKRYTCCITSFFYLGIWILL